MHGGVGGSLAFGEAIAIANPLQVMAIAHARVKTDKVDAGTLAGLFAAGYLPEIWTSDTATERKRRLTARRISLSVFARGSRTKCTDSARPSHSEMCSL